MQCRLLKRCILCVIAVGILPVVLIYSLVGDEFYKIKHHPTVSLKSIASYCIMQVIFNRIDVRIEGNHYMVQIK